MSSNRKDTAAGKRVRANGPQAPSRPAQKLAPAPRRQPHTEALPVRERMRDLATDAVQPDPAAVRPGDPYLADAAGAKRAGERGTQRAMTKAGGCADPALLLNDVLEIDALGEQDAAYARYSDGFTRTSRVQGSGDPNGALGRELRPSFVAFLIRRLHQNDEALAGHAVAAILGELRAAGEQERKWAGALALRLCWNLTQREIARDLGLDQSTVGRYLHAAEAWLVDYLERQDWVRAYLYNDAAPRYHIAGRPTLRAEESDAPDAEEGTHPGTSEEESA